MAGNKGAVDRGSKFQSLSPDFRAILRKRSNTVPSVSRPDLLSPIFSDDNDSYLSDYDNHSVFTPERNKSTDIKPIGRNLLSAYRSSDGVSPMSPLTQMGETNSNKNLNHSYDRAYTPMATNSLAFANMSSPLSPLMTPVSLINSPNPHMPSHFRYLSYSPLYGHTFGNPYSDYSSNQIRFNHSDRVSDLVKQHKNAATHAEARHTWSGVLPASSPHKAPIYSCKVFLGGVPWEMTDHDIKLTFSRFGNVTILRPGQHVKLSRTSQNKDKAGYLYLIFESDKQVKSLINACTHDFSNGGKYYFALNQSRYRPKDVQIIPWNTNDVNYVRSPSARLDTSKTVFVGALHGMLTAEGLACILEDLFGGVVYVGIDTDKYKYPIGSGRVTFSTTKAYNKAVQAAFIDVKSNRFQKKIQIDPFLEESNCSQCHSEKGPIFCRDLCMSYFCRNCWDALHSVEGMRDHQPIMRTKTKF